MKNLITTLFILSLIWSCQEKPIDQAAEAEKLMELSRAWAEAAMSRDVEKIVAFWADDAVLMSPDEPTMKGKDAIRDMVNASMQIPGFEVNWVPREAYVSKDGNMGYVLINNYFKIPTDTLGNTMTIFNKGVEIWKKQEDGSWQNVVDIYNGDPTINSLD